MINIHVAALKFHFDPNEELSYTGFLDKMRKWYRESSVTEEKTFAEYLAYMADQIQKRKCF